MWALKNYTPYAADRTWIRDKAGAHHWVVAVKATFSVSSDGVRLADEQVHPLLEPQYFGESTASSLRYDADLGFSKPETDIIVNGCAHAPRGRPASSVVVELRVANIRKTLIVHGAREFSRGLAGLVITAARPFEQFPITYESAYGGMCLGDPDPKRQRIEPRNPVGKGVAMNSAALVGRPAYRVEYPGHLPSATPAGFGPIASHWSPRRELAGTYDERWEQTQRPLLATDYDDRFALCSPVDQRPSKHLNGGELVELVNLTPGGRLSFHLPKIYLTFSTRFGPRNKEHRGKLVSVILEPEIGRIMVVWQTTLPVVARDIDYLDETIVREKRYLA